MAEKSKSPEFAVIDASFLLAFLLPDESITRVDALMSDFQNKITTLISSPLLFFEVLNGLLAAVRQRRLSRQKADILIQNVLALDIELKPVNFAEVYRLAYKHNLTVYDASYFWLAKQERLSLFTFDKQLSSLTP